MRINITPHPTKPGWYYLEYRPDGYKGKRERLPVKGYDQAASLREDLERKFACPETSTTTHPRIKDLYEEYLEWVKTNQAPATYQAKKTVFKNTLIPHFGNYRVRELTQTTFDLFQQTLPGKRRAIIMYQHFLMAMIKWMVKRKKASPLDFTPEEPKYHAPKVVVPSMEDIQKVIDYVTAPDKKMLLITMLWTGLRWNEARLLRWEDVYPKQKIIRVRESQQEEEVHVPIYPEMLAWFRDGKKKMKSGWIFPNPNTKKKEPWGSFKMLLRFANKKLGLDVDHHDFRRRSGQNVFEASGFDIFAAQRHLRHKDIRTTMRYLGVDDQRRTQVMDNVIVHVDKLRKTVKPRKTRKKPIE